MVETFILLFFLLLQPTLAKNKPAPLGAMLTKGAVRAGVVKVVTENTINQEEEEDDDDCLGIYTVMSV